MKNLTVNLISESTYLPKGHGVHTAFLNTVQMLKEKKVNVLINSTKKADITHIHTTGPLAWYKLLTSEKVVVSAHLIPNSFVGSIIFSKYWLHEASAYLKVFYNQADLVLAVSKTVQEQLRTMGVSKPVEVLPNPVNNRVFRRNPGLRQDGRKVLGLAEDDFAVLGVGQIQPRKGIETFSQTAKNLPGFKFIWVGGRPIKKLTAGIKELDQLMEKKPENLFFTHDVAYEKMPLYYNAADTFFFPSYQENAPMAVIEAASVGLPLVLRDLPEYKLLYERGYLVGNDKDFAEVISGLNEDKKEYLRWSEEATGLSAKFTFEVLGDKLIRYYQGLIDS